MSIFKRSATDKQATPTPAASGQAGQQTLVAPPGVVPPPAAPIYSTRPPEPAGSQESPVAQKVRQAREAQQRAREKLRSRTAPTPARRLVSRPAQTTSMVARAVSLPGLCDGPSIAQAGLLNLAWSWQEAGSPIRAIHAYVELLTRYPDTPAACSAVEDLVQLSLKLVDDGQFHTALAIYDYLEHLA